MNNENYWKEFDAKLSEIGVEKGDIVYVGSDITAIVVQAQKELGLKTRSEINNFIDDLINALQSHVTMEGTLLFPVYSWGFCRGEAFDYYKTQGEVGSLNNYILNNRKDFVRTKHPIYSFMVWGKDAKMLYGMNNQEAWGKASPFYYMHQNGAKELDLNIRAVRSMTFKHYVEMSQKVPYRHPKYFIGYYTDENGVTEERTYSMWVRRLDVKLKATEDNIFFEEKNVGKSTEFRGWGMHVIDLKGAYEVLKDDLLHNEGKNLYSFEGYKLDWDDKQNVYEVGFWRDRSLITY